MSRSNYAESCGAELGLALIQALHKLRDKPQDESFLMVAGALGVLTLSRMSTSKQRRQALPVLWWTCSWWALPTCQRGMPNENARPHQSRIERQERHRV